MKHSSGGTKLHLLAFSSELSVTSGHKKSLEHLDAILYVYTESFTRQLHCMHPAKQQVTWYGMLLVVVCLVDRYRRFEGKLRRLVAGFPPQRTGLDARSGHVEFVVDEVTLGQVFSEYFNFPCQFSFHRLLHTHLSSGAGTVGPVEADVPSILSLNPPQNKKEISGESAFILLARRRRQLVP
jgi:hypothetical protein